MATASRVLPEVFDSAPESWPWPPGAWRPSCFQFIPFIPFRGLVHEPEIEDLHRSRTATKSSWSRRNSGQPKRANAMVWQSSLVQTGPCHYDRGQCPAPGCAPPGAVRQFPCGSTGSTVAMSSSHARAPGFPRSRSDALSGRARSNRQLKSELSAQIATAKMFGHVILSMLCVCLVQRARHGSCGFGAFLTS